MVEENLSWVVWAMMVIFTLAGGMEMLHRWAVKGEDE